MKRMKRKEKFGIENVGLAQVYVDSEGLSLLVVGGCGGGRYNG